MSNRSIDLGVDIEGRGLSGRSRVLTVEDEEDVCFGVGVGIFVCFVLFCID